MATNTAFNLARMTTSTVGAGTLTLVAAVPGYLTFALAGVPTGSTVSYTIRDGANSESGTGVYTTAGLTLTRTPISSTNSNAAISLSGNADVAITFLASDLAGLAQLAGATMTGALVLAAGTTALAPLKFTSGTNLTTATAGVCEYDGTVFYATPTANNRHIMLMEQFIQLNVAFTLTSQTGAQKLFNSTTNGALTVAIGTYEFECYFSLTSLSATSGGFGFALGGTATFTQGWWCSANKPTTGLSTPGAGQTTFNTTANVLICTATTNTTGYAMITGTIRVTVAGTIIPQVSLGVAAAAIVGINSYFFLKPMGSATVTNVGNWS